MNEALQIVVFVFLSAGIGYAARAIFLTRDDIRSISSVQDDTWKRRVAADSAQLRKDHPGLFVPPDISFDGWIRAETDLTFGEWIEVAEKPPTFPPNIELKSGDLWPMPAGPPNRRIREGVQPPPSAVTILKR